jgi:hypothetical protein
MTDEVTSSTPGPEGNAALRTSDADRERTAAALRRHHLDGRLDTDELQDRLGRCYAARTEGELAALLADLPAAERPPRRRAAAGPAIGAPLLVLVLLAAAVAGSAAAVAHGGHPGPLPLLAVFLVLRMRRGPWRAGGPRV